MARIGEIDGAEAREGHAVAAVAGRHHAVEHVDAARDRFQQIMRRADAHQIARAVRRQRRRRLLDDFEHDVLRLADRQPADGVAVEADIDQLARALLAQADVVAALHDAEQGVALARPALEGALRALAPAQRQFHRARRCPRAWPAAAGIRRAAWRCRRRAAPGFRSRARAKARAWRRRDASGTPRAARTACAGSTATSPGSRRNR